MLMDLSMVLEILNEVAVIGSHVVRGANGLPWCGKTQIDIV